MPKYLEGIDIYHTFASAFASETGCLLYRQVLFDRITWNREVVVQEASPSLCFSPRGFTFGAVYGYMNANRPILFFDRVYEVCRLNLFFVYGYSD